MHVQALWAIKKSSFEQLEAGAFWTLACLCLPLGNYHNMQAIDEVQAGRRPARVGREFVSIADYHGLIEMLEVVAAGLDRKTRSDLSRRLKKLRSRNKAVLS